MVDGVKPDVQAVLADFLERDNVQLAPTFELLSEEERAFAAPALPQAISPQIAAPRPTPQPVFGAAIDDPALAAAQRRATGVPGGLATLLSGIGGAIGGGVSGAQQAIKGTREGLQQPIQNILQQRQAVLQTQRAQRQRDLNDPTSQTSKFLQNQFIKQTEALTGRKLSEEELGIARNLRASDAPLVQNALQTEQGISNLASTINQRRLKGIQDVLKRQDKLTVQQEKDRKELTKLSIPGRGILMTATKDEAKEARKALTARDKASRAIDNLLELVDEFGNNPLKKLTKFEAQALVKAFRIPLQGALRLDLVGPGAVSEFEQKLLQAVIAEPGEFFTIASSQRVSLNALKEQINAALEDKFKSLGLLQFEPGQEVLLGIKKAQKVRQTIRVQNPDGQIGIIPTENLDKALKAGFKRIE